MYWYYCRVWPLRGWSSSTMQVWWPAREVPGVGLAYGILAYETPLPEDVLAYCGLVPAMEITDESPPVEITVACPDAGHC